MPLRVPCRRSTHDGVAHGVALYIGDTGGNFHGRILISGDRLVAQLPVRRLRGWLVTLAVALCTEHFLRLPSSHTRYLKAASPLKSASGVVMLPSPPRTDYVGGAIIDLRDG